MERRPLNDLKAVIPFYSPLDSGKPALFAKVAKLLMEKYGLEIVCVTYGVNARNFLRANFPEAKEARDIFDEIADSRAARQLTKDNLAMYERKYGMPNLMLYATAAGPDMERMNHAQTIRAIVAQLDFWERLFSETKAEAYIDEGIGGFALPVYPVAKKFGVQLVNILTARYFGKVVITDSPDAHWPKMTRLYCELNRRPLALQEVELAENFLVDFISRKAIPPYTSALKPYVTWRSGAKLARYIWNYRLEDSARPFISGSMRVASHVIRRVARDKLVSVLRIWDCPISGEEFWLFPLMAQPEASTLLHAPFYVDQPALIRNIAQSLPVDDKLYVKEHVGSLGTRPLSFYREIKSIPNVRLLSPFEDVPRLIRLSSGVITITSTMGWEALLYEKPCVVFGETFYDFFEGIAKIESITQLPAILQSLSGKPPPTREALLKLILSYLRTTCDAEIVWDLPETLSQDNVDRLCKAVMAELHSRGY
jgi:hypothetical protein